MRTGWSRDHRRDLGLLLVPAPGRPQRRPGDRLEGGQLQRPAIPPRQRPAGGGDKPALKWLPAHGADSYTTPDMTVPLILVVALSAPGWVVLPFLSKPRRDAVMQFS